MPLTVGLTYNLKRDCPNRLESEDAAAEYESEDTVDGIAEALSQEGRHVVLLPHRPGLAARLEQERPDIVFNIAEGWFGRNRESLIPGLLELLGIPYSGSDSLALGVALDKAMAKRVVSSAGIPTPQFCKVNSPEEAMHLDLRYPVFVKPNSEGSSKGIRNSSRINNRSQLLEKVEWITTVYNQPAIIEPFLPGREFSVGLLGNGPNLRVLPIIEVCPGGRDEADHEFVYSYETKSGNLEWFKCPAPVSRELQRRIAHIAIGVYNLLECKDFARVDIRLDGDGNPQFLEINPLPGLSKVSLYPLQANAGGIGFTELINTILESAWSRYYDVPMEAAQRCSGSLEQYRYRVAGM